MKQKSLLFILVMASLAAFGPLSIDMYLPALPEVKDELHSTTAEVQLTLSFFMFGLALGNIIFGTLSDTTGRKKPLIFSLIVYIVVSLFSAVVNEVTLLILLRFIQGIAGGAGIVLSRAISSDLYKGKDLTKFLALLMLVNGAAPVFAPMLGGFILSFFSYRAIFLFLTLLSSLMLLGVITKVPESLPLNLRRESSLIAVIKDYQSLITRKSFILPILIQGFTFAIFFSYMAASPFILQNIYQLNAQQYSYVFALTGFGLILNAQITARLVNYIDQQKLFRFYSSLQIIAGIIVIISLLNHWSLWVLIPAFLFIVAPVSGVATLGFSLAMNGQKKSVGSASSLIGLLQYFIGAVATPLVGLQGEESVIPYIIVLALVSFIIIMLHIINYKINLNNQTI
ncbi:multidrug effflux MFS transporter [Macrococcoides canis]|uniref:multidrug effflux MFS transporter n=1 Tax=Macrococcoides canis TaxID=1855823 RepID=UPI0020B72C3E|nr:multidrug effflux MFS transporter [Macrococcus canis]UTH00205.1 multidrug effflux MFS transporter [Macrococcus canis]